MTSLLASTKLHRGVVDHSARCSKVCLVEPCEKVFFYLGNARDSVSGTDGRKKEMRSTVAVSPTDLSALKARAISAVHAWPAAFAVCKLDRQ